MQAPRGHLEPSPLLDRSRRRLPTGSGAGAFSAPTAPTATLSSAGPSPLLGGSIGAPGGTLRRFLSLTTTSPSPGGSLVGGRGRPPALSASASPAPPARFRWLLLGRWQFTDLREEGFTVRTGSEEEAVKLCRIGKVVPPCKGPGNAPRLAGPVDLAPGPESVPQALFIPPVDPKLSEGGLENLLKFSDMSALIGIFQLLDRLGDRQNQRREESRQADGMARLCPLADSPVETLESRDPGVDPLLATRAREHLVEARQE